MKKNLRLLCLGLAAAAFSTGFAQVDKTSLLKNTDMEQGLKGWAFDGERILGKNTKDVHSSIGFHGMSEGVLEAWNGNAANPIGNGYIMQRIGGLESGTYVFGAYVGAAKQNNRVVDPETKKEVKVWENRDSIQGVSLFANNATVRVATENPDMAVHGHKWAHSSKFNVAVTLTDNDAKKGYLDVGLRVEGTNANYVVWDNATLYFFADKTEAEALDAMAAIDMKNAAAIADTLVKEHINVDTLKALNDVIAEAKKGTTTAATLWQDAENLHYIMGLARKSAADYENLAKNIELAKVVAEDDCWRGEFADAVALLEETIAEAEAAYDAKKLNRKDLTTLRTKLSWYAADVKYDSVYYAVDALNNFILDAKAKENVTGGYTSAQIAMLGALKAELGKLMTDYDNEYEEFAASGKFEERTINPNTIIPYIAKVYAAIEEVKANPISGAYTQMPIRYEADAEGYVAGTKQNATTKLYEFVSPVYKFEGAISKFRITIEKSKNNQKFFTLSEFELYDGLNNKIALPWDSIYTNASHNALNEGEDGQDLEGLVDENLETYFHSTYGSQKDANGNDIGAHYLEISLPNPLASFSFKMISRKGQPHQFPAVMTISTPTPERDALVATLAKAKELNAYAVNAPGFYETEKLDVANLVIEVEKMLKGYPTEKECAEKNAALKKAIATFEADKDNYNIVMPVSGKEYRIISALPDFYTKQAVEKALTFHAADSTLWWENVSDSKNQLFVLNLLDTKVNSGVGEDGTPYENVEYFYSLQHKATGLYLGGFVDNHAVMVEDEEGDDVVTMDSVKLVSLGRGQWAFDTKNGSGRIHAGDHNGGAAGTGTGAYGGTWGISSAIVSYGGGLDGCSAWFIREYSELPMNVVVSGAEFKSECIHFFESANTVVLEADKACAFKNLALYDLYGTEIEVDSIGVEGKVATIIIEKGLVACAFGFANEEGVTSVKFNAFTPKYFALQKAYDEAVAFAPVEGDSIGQYADITDYTAALAQAEELISANSEDEVAIEAAIKALEDAVEALEPNLPEAGKYYFIYIAYDEFAKRNGYRMAAYTDGMGISWGNENFLDWNQYWQFEEATAEQLKDAGVEAAGTAYFIKSVATGRYLARFDGDNPTPQVDKISEAVPYQVTMLGNMQVAIEAITTDGLKRWHANYHGSGAGMGSNIIYYWGGANSASSWYIVETEYDATNIDVIEVSDNKVVVKGIYDLFGRRVDAATAPGIYIINGKKTLVK